MPADTNIEDFDSAFVKALSFSVVASLYFILLFTHCAATTTVFGRGSGLDKWQAGLRFGVSYPVFEGRKHGAVKRSLLTTGINWLIFNEFIGRLFKDALGKLALCALHDVIPFGIVTYLLKKRKQAR